MTERMVCWPQFWIDAAIKAGLASPMDGGGFRVLGGEEMRERLQVFAEEITEKAME
jgi:hypothetical protein